MCGNGSLVVRLLSCAESPWQQLAVFESLAACFGHVAINACNTVQINGPLCFNLIPSALNYKVNFKRRKRRAFEITETELKLIANAAIAGLSRIPKIG